MKLLRQNWAVLFSLLLGIPLHAQQLSNVQVKTANGVLEGVVSADGTRSFKGVPYAAPPDRVKTAYIWICGFQIIRRRPNCR
jgi:hypothetical protein